MKMDSRTRIITVACLGAVAVIMTSIKEMSVLLLAIIILMYIVEIDYQSMFACFKGLLPVLIVLFLFQAFAGPRGGFDLIKIGETVLVDSSRLQTAVVIVMRLVLIAGSAFFLSSGNLQELVLGFIYFKLPYELAFMVFVAIKFMPFFRDEFKNVLCAVQLRGIDSRKLPLKDKLYLFCNLLMPVVYGAVLKARYLAISMDARGFRAYPVRTYFRVLKMRKIDYLILPAVTLFSVIMMYLHYCL